MASANSRGDSEGCGRGFIQAATATLLVSCVLVCVLLSAPEQLLGMFQNGPEVLALAKTYCMIRCGQAAGSIINIIIISSSSSGSSAAARNANTVAWRLAVAALICQSLRSRLCMHA
jgi:Na+-driven multidrug efflux pump